MALAISFKILPLEQNLKITFIANIINVTWLKIDFLCELPKSLLFHIALEYATKLFNIQSQTRNCTHSSIATHINYGLLSTTSYVQLFKLKIHRVSIIYFTIKYILYKMSTRNLCCENNSSPLLSKAYNSKVSTVSFVIRWKSGILILLSLAFFEFSHNRKLPYHKKILKMGAWNTNIVHPMFH